MHVVDHDYNDYRCMDCGWCYEISINAPMPPSDISFKGRPKYSQLVAMIDNSKEKK